MQDNINVKLNIERKLSGSEDIVQVYEVGKYTVVVRGQRKSTGDNIYMDIRRRQDIPDVKYLPHLYEDCFDDEGRARSANLLVGTTSYGVLSLVEISRFMKAMEEGVTTAKYIRKKFLQPMVAGKWNWAVTE